MQSALGDAVEQLDLAGCELLTDATVIEIVPRCPNLRVAIQGRVQSWDTRAVLLHQLMSPALSYRGEREVPGQTSKLTDPSIIALANACKSLVTLDLLGHVVARGRARERLSARAQADARSPGTQQRT